MKMRNIRRMVIPVALVVLLLGVGCPGTASSEVRLLKGQTVYVPTYSHIYYGDREQPLFPTVTLSIRNTNPDHSITLIKVDYYDSERKLLKNYLDKEIKLGATASTLHTIKESDNS